jgi:hypothetical protein
MAVLGPGRLESADEFALVDRIANEQFKPTDHKYTQSVQDRSVVGGRTMELKGSRPKALLFVRLAATLALVACGSAWTASPAFASPYEHAVTVEDFEDKRIYSPYAGRNYPDQVLFGDTHFHTNLSFDAGLVGTILDVDAGYRFAS